MNSKVIVNLPAIFPHINSYRNHTIKNLYEIEIQDLLEIADGFIEIINNHQNIDYLLCRMESLVPQLTQESSQIDQVLHKIFAFMLKLKPQLHQWSVISSGLARPINRDFAASYQYDEENATVSRQESNIPRRQISPEELMQYKDTDVSFALYVITEAFKYITMEPNYVFDTSLPVYVMLLFLVNNLSRFSEKSTITQNYGELLFVYCMDLAARSRYIDLWRDHVDMDRYITQLNSMYKEINITSPVTNILTKTQWQSRMNEMTKRIGKEEYNLAKVYSEIVQKSTIPNNSELIDLGSMYQNLLNDPQMMEYLTQFIGAPTGVPNQGMMDKALAILDEYES